jgi:hypothetical protein
MQRSVLETVMRAGCSFSVHDARKAGCSLLRAIIPHRADRGPGSRRPGPPQRAPLCPAASSPPAGPGIPTVAVLQMPVAPLPSGNGHFSTPRLYCNEGCGHICRLRRPGIPPRRRRRRSSSSSSDMRSMSRQRHSSKRGKTLARLCMHVGCFAHIATLPPVGRPRLRPTRRSLCTCPRPSTCTTSRPRPRPSRQARTLRPRPRRPRPRSTFSTQPPRRRRRMNTCPSTPRPRQCRKGSVSQPHPPLSCDALSAAPLHPRYGAR